MTEIKEVQINTKIDEITHKAMKHLAIDKNLEIKQLVRIAIMEYIERNKK